MEIFVSGKTCHVYEFDSLPISHMLIIEEIYEFKRQQIKRPAPTFDAIVSSGGATYFQRAVSYLLLPSDDAGAVLTRDINPKKTEAFVASLTGGEQLRRLEDCMRDFFGRRGKQELESDVRSRSFLQLADLAQLGLALQMSTGVSPETEPLKSDVSSTDSTTQANSIRG